SIDAAAATEGELDSINQSLGTLGKILDSPGLSGFSGMDQFRSWIPGTSSANVKAWINQLDSQNFLTAVTQMKGMGALSENEGRKLSAAVAALDSNMTDDALRQELIDIQETLVAAKDRIETGKFVNSDGSLREGSPLPEIQNREPYVMSEEEADQILNF
ncbi:MAG: hypothetical protein HRU12_12680, partial [Phaeodactylibacter sp.]|nr:hypothetical protein [Phaeodactylibacter sp.]